MDNSYIILVPMTSQFGRQLLAGNFSGGLTTTTTTAARAAARRTARRTSGARGAALPAGSTVGAQHLTTRRRSIKRGRSRKPAQQLGG